MSATTTTTTISNGSKKIEVLITSSSTANRLNEATSRDYSNPATLTNSSEVKNGTTLTNSSRIVISTPPSPIQSPLSPTRPEFYSSNDDDEDDDENDEEENRIIEESPNGRWSKLLCEISTQKLADFDTAHLAIDSERGCEVAWNEMLFNKQPNTLTTSLSMSTSQKQHRNRFVSAEALRTIYEKLENILKLLVKLEHSNLLRVYDYWFVDNAHVAKLVVITEYSSAGCLRRILDAAMIKSSGGGSGSIGANARGRIKYQTGRRWLNQTLYLLRCLHHDGISLFQGTFTAETIFIQSCGVIKLAPVLLALNGLCVCENGVYRPTGASAPRIELKDENRLKDKQALGRLAIQIFTAHIKPASSPGGSGSSRNSNRMDPNIAINVDDYLTLIDEPLQRDFVRACFEPSNSVESIWLHPFLNCIYSLKVLSVYSIFAYFQEKRQQLDLATNSPPNNNQANNLLNSTGRKNSFSSQSSSSSLAKLRKNSSKFSQIFAAADSTAGKIAQIRSHFERIYTVSECNDDEHSIDNEEENDDVEVELSSSLGSLRRTKKDLKDLPPRPPPPNNGVQQKIIIHEGDAPPAAQNHAPTPLGLSSSQNNASYSNLMTKFSKNRELSRKVSLTFLTNVHDLKIPQDFFSILEDIRSGLYPRLFKDWDSSAESASKSIPSTQYIDFMIQHKQLMVDRRRASLSSQHELSDIVGQSSLLTGRNSSNSVCEANMGSRAMSRTSSRMSSRNGLSSAAGSSSRLLSKMHSIDTGDVELSSMRERLQQPQEEVHDMLLNHHHHHHHYHHPPLPVSPLAMETANINSGANVAFSPPTLKNYPVEMRRIVKNECLIRKGSSPSRSKLTTAKIAGGIEIGESSTTLTPQQTPSSSPHYTASQPVAINKPSTTMNSMVELALSLEFDDSTRRSIYSHFPVEFLDKLKLEHAKSSYELDRCAMTAGLEYLDYVMYESPFEDKLRKVAEHLSHELVDNGLISPKDFVLIADLFYKTIEESIANDAAASADASSAPLLHFYLSPSTSRDCLLDDIFI